jgi:MoaA/NifB/PqqE/SkfB family radical SAM enzyme
MRRNLHELPALVTLAHELGSRHLSVQHLCHDFSESTLPPPYRPMREFVDSQTLRNEDPERVLAVFDEARERARRLGVELRLPRVEPRMHAPGTRGRERCDWPWRGAYLSYSGEAMPCCMVSTPDRLSLGNMARDGVANTWTGEAYAAFRRALDGGPPPEVCRGCSLYHGTF